MKLLPIIGGLVAFVLLRANCCAATSYTVTDISPSVPCYAYGINAHGDVTGYLNYSGGARAFLYSGGVMTELPTAGASDTYGYGINDDGSIVGNQASLPLNVRCSMFDVFPPTPLLTTNYWPAISLSYSF
jgi:probable HAF family extracellular repeat protein